MRFSFKTRPQHTDWQSLVDFWREGDRIATYDAGWTFDHFSPIFSDRPGPCFEAWTMLAALTQVVSRLRLGVLVTGNTYRHPALLAHMAATADVMSEGRLEIGLGTGWVEAEHQAFGVSLPPWKERFDRLEETCAILDALLTREATTFDGRFYRLVEARLDPRPIQKPRPPIVIGGIGERRTLPIAARWADQWNLPAGEPDLLAHKVSVLHEHCRAIGRDPAEIEVSVKVKAGGDPAAVAERAAAYREAGAQHVIAMFEAPFRPATLGALADHLADIGR
jgi:F420-dependent oxidoreductase-like protein